MYKSHCFVLYVQITIVVLFCVVIVYAVLFSWPCCYFFRSFLLQLFVLFNFISYHFFYSPYLCFLVVLFVVVILFKIIFRVSSFPFCFVLFLYSCVAHFAWESFLNSSSVSFFPLPDFPYFSIQFPSILSLYFFLSVFFSSSVHSLIFMWLFSPWLLPLLPLPSHAISSMAVLTAAHDLKHIQSLTKLWPLGTFQYRSQHHSWIQFLYACSESIATLIWNRFLRLFGIDLFANLHHQYFVCTTIVWHWIWNSLELPNTTLLNS